MVCVWQDVKECKFMQISSSERVLNKNYLTINEWMKHVVEIKCQILYFARVSPAFSMAVVRMGYSGIFGIHINSPQHILLRVKYTPIKYFSYCYVKYIIENLSTRLVMSIYWGGQCGTISTPISHPFKGKLRKNKNIYKIKYQNIRRSSLWSSW